MDLLLIILIILLLCGGGYGYYGPVDHHGILGLVMLILVICIIFRLFGRGRPLLLVPFALATLFLSSCTSDGVDYGMSGSLMHPEQAEFHVGGHFGGKQVDHSKDGFRK